MSEILIGSAGWSYEDWEGLVYPQPAPPGFDPLAYLAQFLPTIEINSTFYRPPAASSSESWTRRTPDGFVFTVKAWEKFTHDRTGPGEAEARGFVEGIRPLFQAGKLGAILLQYPWFFQDGAESRDRVRRAVEALQGWAPLVFEVRHRSWLDALDFVREQGLCFCNIDQPKSSTAITGTSLVTGPVGYVRLHGRNAKAWFSKEAPVAEKYNYLYKAEELEEWVSAIRSMEADRLFVILNNHFQGKGLVNAFQLRKALGQEGPVPDLLRSHYPELA